MQKKVKIPKGIWAISIIYYMSSVVSLVIAGFFFFKSSILQNLPGFDIALKNSVIYTFGVFMVFFAILSFCLARGLLKGKNWARTVLIILSIINIVGGSFSILKKDYLSVMNVAFNLIVLIYILVNRRVKMHFERK